MNIYKSENTQNTAQPLDTRKKDSYGSQNSKYFKDWPPQTCFNIHFKSKVKLNPA